jgi:hypothetical protein
MSKEGSGAAWESARHLNNRAEKCALSVPNARLGHVLFRAHEATVSLGFFDNA